MTEGMVNPEQNPIILDIEASGFGAGSYPIEIGLALTDGGKHSWLIKPLAHWQHWREQAQALHGISRERLCAEGLAPATVADQLNEVIGPATAYTDAWGFDSTWLSRLFHDAGRRQVFRLEAVVALLTEDELERWQESRDLIIEHSGLARHRAGNDATIIQQTLMRVRAAALPARASSGTHLEHAAIA